MSDVVTTVAAAVACIAAGLAAGRAWFAWRDVRRARQERSDA